MTLPWLRKKQMTGTSVVKRSEGGSMDEMSSDEEGLRSAASDLLSAIKGDDVAAVASALRAAIEICDAYPHEEGVEVSGSLGE